MNLLIYDKNFKVVIWQNVQLALMIKSRRMFHQLLVLPIHLYKNLKIKKKSGVRRRLRDDNFLSGFVLITESYLHILDLIFLKVVIQSE